MSSKRPTRRTHRQEEAIHLNITPFLDILVCLILFLLSSAAFLKLSVVDTNLPQLADVSTVVEQTPEEKLVVTLHIEESGFVVSRVGGDANPNLQKRWGEGGDLRIRIPRLSQGKYDFDTLNRHMRKVKSVYPQAVSVMLLPGGEIAYEVIVSSMDATREAENETTGKRDILFPDAIIGHVAEVPEGA